MGPMAMAAAAAQGVKTLTGIGQMIAGGIQLRKANKNRPLYEIPDEFNQNVSAADRILNMGMPREQYLASLTGIDRNQSFGLRALGDRRSGLAGISNLVQQGNDATLRLNATDAEMRNRNMLAGTQMGMNARYQRGMQRLAKQQWDKFNPFLAKVANAQGMLGAGMQNFSGGAGGFAQLGMSELGGDGTGASPGGTRRRVSGADFDLLSSFLG